MIEDIATKGASLKQATEAKNIFLDTYAALFESQDTAISGIGLRLAENEQFYVVIYGESRDALEQYIRALPDEINGVPIGVQYRR